MHSDDSRCRVRTEYLERLDGMAPDRDPFDLFKGAHSPSDYLLVTFTFCAAASGFLAIVIVNTPFSSSAATFSPSKPAGSVKLRTKLP